METMFKLAKAASRTLNLESEERINRALLKAADALEHDTEAILVANRTDLDRMELSDPLYDRLMLSPKRVAAMASDIRVVAGLRSPVGEIISTHTRPNGMKIDKVRVPLGVVGVIFEARPNVSSDIFALCFKSGNCSLLKGSRNASHSNKAITGIIRRVLEEEGMDPAILTLLPDERPATDALINAVGMVDVVIPRGGRELIDYVRRNSQVPVIETGAGVCHVYFDREGDIRIGTQVVLNAKTRRVSVCNALDCLLVHEERLNDIAALCAPLSGEGVIIFADPASLAALRGNYPEKLLRYVSEDSYGTEFLDYKMALHVVPGIHEAIDHIDRYGSRHSESIVTEDHMAARLFARSVDAACVYTNLPTSFTDGAQFGFGAEIGISTQKLHARGPMGLPELTTYKYVITGHGQTREE